MFYTSANYGITHLLSAEISSSMSSVFPNAEDQCISGKQVNNGGLIMVTK